MEDFIVSARKYRPGHFDDVVGQQAITTTLRNAIRSRHLAHAFLFCGSRGVGKTTCARILAKTINCTSLTPETEACDQCDSCKSFNKGQSLNVIELDAASNNSVDDIRNLVEQVRYPPQAGSYKVYIIDEAHMLSQNAFNAFLKTLEEPPPYAIFILATTEKHKIIPTILSRCQIFDFNRISTDDIAAHLELIAGKEKITADPEALHIIAMKAEGALRDALSIFDQVVSFAGNKVTYKDVIDNLNILDYEFYFRMADYILAGDQAGALLTFNELLREGYDGQHFINGFGSHLRDLLVCADTRTIELLEVGKAIRERYGKQAKAIPQALLYTLLDHTAACESGYRASRNPRLHVELALIRMCRAANGEPEKKSERGATTKAVEPARLKTEKPESATSPAPTQRPAPLDPLPPEKQAAPAPASPAAAAKPVKAKAVKRDASPDSTGAPVTLAIPSIRLAGPDEPDKEKKEASDSGPVVQKDNPVTAGKLEEVWRGYCDTVLDPHRRNLVATLSKRKPRLEGKHRVVFEVDNDVQQKEIHSGRKELLGYLQEILANTHLRLDLVVLPPEKRTDDAYTPAEKFKKMAEQNPALDKLKKQFDLDL